MKRKLGDGLDDNEPLIDDQPLVVMPDEPPAEAELADNDTGTGAIVAEGWTAALLPLLLLQYADQPEEVSTTPLAHPDDLLLH